MAVLSYVGLHGSGKSYGVVEYVILPALKQGRRVVTNIPLNTELLQSDFPDSEVHIIKTEEINEKGFFKSDILKGSICAFDEIWRFWPSGLKANKADEEHKEFFAEHRHLVDDKGNSTQIVLMTQTLTQVAAFVRDQIETTYKITKLTAVGKDNSYRVDVITGAHSGPNIPEHRQINRLFGTYKPGVYKYYKSATKSDSGAVGDESRPDNRGSIWANKTVWFYLIGGPLLLMIGFWGAYRAVTGMVPDSKTDPESETVQHPDVQRDSMAQPIPTPEPVVIHHDDARVTYADSEKWRLTGIFKARRAKWALLESHNRNITRIDYDQFCEGESLYDAYCIYGDTIITNYTGPQIERQLGDVPRDHDGHYLAPQAVSSDSGASGATAGTQLTADERRFLEFYRNYRPLLAKDWGKEAPPRLGGSR